MYGLRVMLFVNASDYLPTSEAVGIRLTIHDQDEFPFPVSLLFSYKEWRYSGHLWLQCPHRVYFLIWNEDDQNVETARTLWGLYPGGPY